MKNASQAEQVAEFNMGVASMQRIDAILRKLTECNTILFMDGQPLQPIILRELIRLHKEIYPYMEEAERTEAQAYLQIFKDNPIEYTDHSIIFPIITEDKMDEFELYLMDMMMKKGILTKIGDSPYDIHL